jgi:hypothetical protein
MVITWDLMRRARGFLKNKTEELPSFLTIMTRKSEQFNWCVFTQPSACKKFTLVHTANYCCTNICIIIIASLNYKEQTTFFKSRAFSDEVQYVGVHTVGHAFMYCECTIVHTRCLLKRYILILFKFFHSCLKKILLLNK